MLTNLSNTLRKHVTGWLVLLFLAREIFFNAVILPNEQVKNRKAVWSHRTYWPATLLHIR